jgi:hypothetical protein
VNLQQSRLEAAVDAQEAEADAAEAARSLIEDIAILPAQLEATKSGALKEAAAHGWILMLQSFAADVAVQREAFNVVGNVSRS